MSLYSADLIDIAAKPVKLKAKARKNVDKPEEEKNEAPAVPPPKKPRTEKQIQALEKMKIARQLKKDKEEENKKQQAEIEEQKKKEILKKQKQIEEKLEKRREKAKARRENKKSENPGPLTPPGSDRVQKEEPPSWFSKFVETVKKQEQTVAAEKKSQKHVKEEAKEIANDKWNDGLTRGRVRQEVDDHMGRMYSMMFGRR